ncbi:hypothetical protein O7623_14395 [Solwaraspora sp. WMMD791]|uniref:hypothetical protein n=1 Tax=Solwaraspora sp. WMMD791 TaxID=3016086 RepID=UPI00249C26E4|nr:hypothetical protein [Solwaraspora sp. WMMD791]WFE30297.1 hypothetical protein O7623_14395 [Solwaraspora sp. WMMD791]
MAVSSWVAVGPRPYLDRFLREYRLTEAGLAERPRTRPARSWVDGEAFDVEYLVHESVLRSYGEFPCAGDAEALAFCEEIADLMVSRYGLSRDAAVAVVNRQWSEAEPGEREPRMWIVGFDIVYHETPEYWAEFIANRHCVS